jgi:hypothetical protein
MRLIEWVLKMGSLSDRLPLGVRITAIGGQASVARAGVTAKGLFQNRYCDFANANVNETANANDCGVIRF